MNIRITFIAILLFTLFFLSATPSFAVEKTAGSSAQIASLSKEYTADARVMALKSYLERYDSPLAEKAAVFVAEADKNNIDWRLVAAISGVESTFGHQIPYNSYNGWGWGIYGDNTHSFESWEDGISTISKGLRENYMDKWGAGEDVYAIGRIYAASPTWAQRVEYFMNQIDVHAKAQTIETLPLYL